MDRITIASVFADGERLDGQTVTVMGWARTIRDMKTFGFIELNDGSCFKNLQVVMDANALDNYKDIAGQNVGAALIVTGAVVLTPHAKQPLEIKVASIQEEGPSSPAYTAAGELEDAVRVLDDADARDCAIAERSFVKTLGGGCSAPVAA